MSDPLLSSPYHPTYTNYRRGAFAVVVLTFASGVPSIDTDRSAPGFTITGDTGVYTGTMPKTGRCALFVQPFSASNSMQAVVSALDPTAGTFGINVFDLATPSALDVATGDELHLLFAMEGG